MWTVTLKVSQSEAGVDTVSYNLTGVRGKEAKAYRYYLFFKYKYLLHKKESFLIYCLVASVVECS